MLAKIPNFQLLDRFQPSLRIPKSHVQQMCTPLQPTLTSIRVLSVCLCAMTATSDGLSRLTACVS